MEDRRMEEWKERIQQDLSDFKQRQQHNENDLTMLRGDVHKLEVSDQLKGQQIEALKESQKEIKSDTNWLRRTITGAIISAVAVAIVGGIATFAISRIFY